MNYNANKLGYYQVGEFQTYHKFLAISEHRKTNKGVRWIFNENEFGCFNWKSCPDKTLTELYKERAEQLRNDYDVLVLAYSGGSDSQTVLDTFVDNNIFIDHIFSNNAIKGTKDPYAHFNEEITKVAIPHLNKISNKIKHTQTHIIDQTDAIIDSFKEVDWWVNYNNMLAPNCVTRSTMREWYLPFKELINSGKSVAFIWGKEKPQICYDDDRPYTYFLDYVDNNTSPYTQNRSNKGWFDEFFFHDPNWPEIPCRQSHDVLNRLKEKSISKNLLQESPTLHGQCPYTKKYLSTDGLVSIIYPTWNTETFCNGKSHSVVWGKRDQWFFDNYKDTLACKNWVSSIKYLESYLSHSDPNHHWLNTDNIFDNIKGCVSTKYYLTD
jgi:hypothetical protein